jgi:rod shape-determining protein MreB
MGPRASSGRGAGSGKRKRRRSLVPRARGRDIAIDLGTANTLVFVRGEGILVSEPSVVAVDADGGSVHAVGDEAQRMIGRTPASIAAVRPLRHGVIADFEVTEQMLRHFMGRVQSSRFAHPTVIMCAPSGITDVEERALIEASLAAGSRSTHLIEEPLAAAIGAGLEIDKPRANAVVDVGGGTSEVAVISMGEIVASRSARVGGYDFDDAIGTFLRHRHGLSIGERSAEELKREVGSVEPDESDGHKAVRGRDPVTGLPREVEVTSEELRHALEPLVAEIVAAVTETLEQTPPELASDLADSGLLLAGGGGLVKGFKERLEVATRLTVTLADDPLECVALGAGQALEEIEALERGAGRG